MKSLSALVFQDGAMPFRQPPSYIIIKLLILTFQQPGILKVRRIFSFNRIATFGRIGLVVETGYDDA